MICKTLLLLALPSAARGVPDRLHASSPAGGTKSRVVFGMDPRWPGAARGAIPLRVIRSLTLTHVAAPRIYKDACLTPRAYTLTAAARITRTTS